MDSLEFRKKAIDNYNRSTSDNLVYFNPDLQSQTEQRNVFFDSLCIHNDSNFRITINNKCYNGYNFQTKLKI